MGRRKVSTLAVGRLASPGVPSALIALYNSAKAPDTHASLLQVLESPAWSAGHVKTDRLSLDDVDQGLKYFLLVEDDLVFMAVTEQAYRSEFVYGTPTGGSGLLLDLKQEFYRAHGREHGRRREGELSPPSAQFMKRLARKYDDTQAILKQAHRRERRLLLINAGTVDTHPVLDEVEPTAVTDTALALSTTSREAGSKDGGRQPGCCRRNVVLLVALLALLLLAVAGGLSYVALKNAGSAPSVDAVTPTPTTQQNTPPAVDAHVHDP